MEKIIYDVGANNGDDIPYYLMKCDKVVAVEANPEQCEQINQRFSQEIKDGRVFVENYVITDRENMGEVDYYKHVQPHLHICNQFPTPSPDIMDHFIKVRLQSESITNIINKHGHPYYIKLDVNENYETTLLKKLFSVGIRPQYVSAESHNIDVFYTLVKDGRYDLFKLVDGPTISELYKDHSVSTCKNTIEKYSFPHHSAGPFGNDINGDWINMHDFFDILIEVGMGWKDIHATNSQYLNK